MKSTIRTGVPYMWRDAISIVVVVLILAIVWSNPHGISCENNANGRGQTCEEHLKDEEGFFAWAELYLEGKFALPVSEARGSYTTTTVVYSVLEAEEYELTATTSPPSNQQQQPLGGPLAADGAGDGSGADSPSSDGDQITKQAGNIPAGGGPNLEGLIVTLALTDSEGVPVSGSEVRQVRESGEVLLGHLDDSGTWQGVIQQQFGLVMVKVENSGADDLWLLADIQPARRMADIGLVSSMETVVRGEINLSGEVLIVRPPPPDEGEIPPRLALWWDDPEVEDDEWLIGEGAAGGGVSLPPNLTMPAKLRTRTVAGTPAADARLLFNNSIIAISEVGGWVELPNLQIFSTDLSVTIPDGFSLDQVSIAVQKAGQPRREYRDLDWSPSEGSENTFVATLSNQTGLVDDLPSRLSASWQNLDGTPVPMASGLTVHDGELVWANHWSPGPSLVIALLLLVGLESLYGTLVLLTLAVSLHSIGERMVGRGAGRITVALTLLNGGVVMLVHAQWMGDLSTVSLLTAGLATALVVLERQKQSGVEGGDWLSAHTWLLGLSSGLLLGGAVWMRYSSVVVLPCLLFTLFAMERAARGGDDAGRSWFSTLRSGRVWAVSLPVILGALVLGVALGAYNAEWYGGPFNSGYQSDQLIAVEEDGNVSAAEPSESFFGQYLGHMDRDPFTYLGAFMLASLVHLPTIFIPLVAFVAVGPREAKKRLEKRPALATLSFTWFLSVFLVYSTQLWVLNGTITDIRYYLPLLPPAALLSAGIVLPLATRKKVELESLLEYELGLVESDESGLQSDDVREMIDLDAQLSEVGEEFQPVWLLLPLVALVIGILQRTRLEVSQFALPMNTPDMWRPWPDRLAFHPTEVTTMWFTVGILLVTALSLLAYNRKKRLAHES